jgi:predicted permease
VAIRRGLLAAQVALAAILALGAGLMFRTLSNLYDIDLGMQPEGVLAMDVIPAAGAYPEAADRVALYGALVERLEALPGAARAAATCTLPLTEYCGYLSLIVEGGEGTSVGDAHDAVREIVTPSYFEAMGLRLVEGRALAPSDHSEGPLVAVVNETMARDLWPGEEAVGKRFRMWSEGWPYMEVVGVVADVLRRGPDQGADPAFYVTLDQTERAAYGTPGAMSLVVRAAAGDPLALAGAARALVRDIDATAAVTRVRAMSDLVGATVALRRFTLRLLQGFSLVALFLAGVGIYGVMAMVVSERRAEIGLRKALGAAPGRLVGAVLREGIALTLAGGVVGLAAGVVLARWMRTLLYEVSTVDVLTIAAVMTLMMAVAAAASLLPAWRAGRVDPMVALREDGR